MYLAHSHCAARCLAFLLTRRSRMQAVLWQSITWRSSNTSERLSKPCVQVTNALGMRMNHKAVGSRWTERQSHKRPAGQPHVPSTGKLQPFLPLTLDAYTWMNPQKCRKRQTAWVTCQSSSGGRRAAMCGTTGVGHCRNALQSLGG